MLVLLAAVRDCLVALALAWIGVTMEARVDPSASATPPCAEDAQSCGD